MALTPWAKVITADQSRILAAVDRYHRANARLDAVCAARQHAGQASREVDRAATDLAVIMAEVFPAHPGVPHRRQVLFATPNGQDPSAADMQRMARLLGYSHFAREDLVFEADTGYVVTAVENLR